MKSMISQPFTAMRPANLTDTIMPISFYRSPEGDTYGVVPEAHEVRAFILSYRSPVQFNDKYTKNRSTSG